jgi:hypothetical protein
LIRNDLNINIQGVEKKIMKVNRSRRDVIKDIFFCFIVTLPVFNFFFSLFKWKRDAKPTRRELLGEHKLAG